jgi:hypothetical protein
VTSLSDFVVQRWCCWIECSNSLWTSKRYAPTYNLATYHRILFAMAFYCDYISEQKFWTNLHLWQISFLRMLRASRSKTWVIYSLIKSFRCCIQYHAFLLNPLKFDGIASSHFCIAPYHMHHLTSAFITLSKSASIWCNLECILYNLIAIECFRWPLLDCYPLELYLAPHPLDSPCASHALLAIQEHLVCGANSCCFGRTQILSCKLTMIVHRPLGPILS